LQSSLFKFLIIFVAYFTTAKIGLELNAVEGFASLVWPPTGIALSAMILWSPGLWPAVFAAAFSVNFHNGAPAMVAAGIAVGNTLEPLLAVFLLKRIFGFRRSLDKVRDVIHLVVLGVFVGPLVGATIGAASLRFGGLITEGQFWSVWIAWWFGDGMGVLLLAPLFFTISSWDMSRISAVRVFESSIIVTITLAIALFIFASPQEVVDASIFRTYFFFPLILWATIRFTQRGAAFTNLIIAAVSIWGTVNNHGRFAAADLSAALFHLQIFLLVTSTTSLTVAALVKDRFRAESRFQAQFHTAQVLATSSDGLTAIPKILRAICLSLDWDWSAYWHFDERGEKLVYSAHWPASGVEKFREKTEKISFQKGVGLPGRAWALRRPFWIRDVLLDKNFPRGAVAREDRLRSAVAFPIVYRDEVLGVMEFFGRYKKVREDSDLTNMMDTIGHQIGQFIMRARADETLKDTQKELKEAVRARDEFLSIASHELKTPVATLRLQLQLLKRYLAVKREIPPLEKMAGSIDLSTRQTDKLVRLIEDLLDVSRIQSGKFNLQKEKLDVREFLRDVVARFAPEHHPITLDEPNSVGPIVAHWDPLRIEQAVVNLLSNAVKYAPERPVQIRFEADDKKAFISVTDQGQGIPKEHQERIFKRFERAQAARDIGGLGLGLYITEQIAFGHGGAVHVDSEPGRGSKFTLALPL
jgi:signal transduction histidine kinase/integral membrane sensor domain MASE1